MKAIYEFETYKDFLRHWLAEQPGRGHAKKIAQHLQIHSTLLSHIQRGKQNLSEDQALGLAEYFGMNHLETEYWLLLVRKERASTRKLKTRIQTQLEQLQIQSTEVKSRILDHETLTEQDSARFYSSWHFSAIRLLTDIPAFQSREQLVQALAECGSFGHIRQRWRSWLVTSRRLARLLCRHGYVQRFSTRRSRRRANDKCRNSSISSLCKRRRRYGILGGYYCYGRYHKCPIYCLVSPSKRLYVY